VTPARRQSAAHWGIVAALAGAGAALWLVGLELSAPAWCAVMAFTAIAVVQLWRRIMRPTLPGGGW
jgi:hypothetical protein